MTIRQSNGGREEGRVCRAILGLISPPPQIKSVQDCCCPISRRRLLGNNCKCFWKGNNSSFDSNSSLFFAFLSLLLVQYYCSVPKILRFEAVILSVFQFFGETSPFILISLPASDEREERGERMMKSYPRVLLSSARKRGGRRGGGGEGETQDTYPVSSFPLSWVIQWSRS